MKFISGFLIVLLLFGITDFIRFPETYLTTWKYQLQQDIKSGDAEAIEYYQSHYIDKGRILFSNN